MSHTNDRFVKEKELGFGTYGTVYKALDKLTGITVAIKDMKPSTEEEGIPATTIREICLLKKLLHPNIVTLHDITFHSSKLTLVFEFCEYDLKKYMDTKPNKVLDNPNEVKTLLKQLLLGLEFMHSRSVVHRDIKPQNLLLDNNLQLKIADFGLARVEGIPVKKYSHEAVTLWYRPPDVILGSTNYSFVVDIWSVGCIFAEMLTGKPLFNGLNESEQLVKIYKLLGTPTNDNFPNLNKYPNTKTIYQSARNGLLEEHYNPSFDDFVSNTNLSKLGDQGIDLLRRMLTYDPAARITASGALAHPFLANYEIQFLLPNVPKPSCNCMEVNSSTSNGALASVNSKNSIGNSKVENNLNRILYQKASKVIQKQTVINALNEALKNMQNSNGQTNNNISGNNNLLNTDLLHHSSH